MGLAGEIEARDGSRCLHIDDGSQQRYRRQPPSALLPIRVVQAIRSRPFRPRVERGAFLENAATGC